jgi:hypothetical protein
MHIPLTHVMLKVQACPHVPQFIRLVMRLVHPTIGQLVSPGAHWHMPATHMSPPQSMPHIPQLFGSVWVSTQGPMPMPPPQRVIPVPHWHMPETHVPAPQSMPHIPQFIGSLLRSAQPMPIPHITWPVPHWHMPETHVPAPQLRPHIPQLFGSLLRLAQPTPIPHITWPVPHMHWPDTHVPCPQVRPQVPQWAGSLLVSKQPVGHDTSPAEHWQTPPTHCSPGLQVTLPQGTPPVELEPVGAVPVELPAVPVEPPVPAAPVPDEDPHPRCVTRATPAKATGNQKALRRTMARTSSKAASAGRCGARLRFLAIPGGGAMG